MTILDEFERRTIEIRNPDDQIERHPAWCYGEIAAMEGTLDGKPMWQLICIPLGLVFPKKRLGMFHTIEDACGAAKDLAKAHNNWAGVQQMDERLRNILIETGKKYNSDTDIYIDGSHVAQPNQVIPNLNGASVENYR